MTKPIGKSLLIPLLLLTMLLLAGCNAAWNSDDALFGGERTIASGDIVKDDLVVMGGTLTVEEGAQIDGDLTVMGGTVQLDGAVNGELITMGGTVTLGEGARADEITSIGGTVRGADERQVTTPSEPPSEVATMAMNGRSVAERLLAFVGNILAKIMTAIGLGIVGFVMAYFMPNHVRRVANAATTAPAASLGVGCLMIPVLILTGIILAITIIGIPLVVLIGGIFFVLATVGMGYALGDRLLRAADLKSPRITAATAIGAALFFVAYSVVNALPVVGGLASLLIAAWAIGAITLTLGGNQAYPLKAVTTAAPTGYVPPKAARTPEAPVSEEDWLSQLRDELAIDDEDEA
ncbi:MAG: hypothetical protein KDD73_00260 [Anaerolineales bacterium]|nr:hypothetical protein [Anaerolineales bacterium]MCB9127939.1 hypothetical protein [Ardenticatenales bacterium]MCB9171701.1 hypothetical protein [Ardenticatenales bacterium]